MCVVHVLVYILNSLADKREMLVTLSRVECCISSALQIVSLISFGNSISLVTLSSIQVFLLLSCSLLNGLDSKFTGK